MGPSRPEPVRDPARDVVAYSPEYLDPLIVASRSLRARASGFQSLASTCDSLTEDRLLAMFG
jgi:hypothetical protein